ncbi:MAG: nuclear transport factor 2 family protein [Pyrinomonadaceae bacterium]
MRTGLIVTFAIWVCSAFVYGQTTSVGSKTSRAEAELMQIEREIGDANVRRDRAFFERLEAEEFIFTDSGGGLTTKAEDVGSFDKPAGETKLASYVPDEMKVSIYGNTAVVAGRVTSTYKSPKGEAVVRSRFTDVFVKTKGRWQIVAGHSSRIRS